MKLLLCASRWVTSLFLKGIMFVNVVFFKVLTILKCCYSNSSFYFYHVSLTQEKILVDVFLFLSYMKDQVNYYSLHENCVKVFVWKFTCKLCENTFLSYCFSNVGTSQERMEGISAYSFLLYIFSHPR